MVKILKNNYKPKISFEKLTCKSCKSELEVSSRDWKSGWYGNRYIICPACNNEIAHPRDNYGDF